MSIASIGSASPLSPMSSLDSTERGVNPAAPLGPGSAGGVALSRRAQFTSRVLALASTDPAEAKRMVRDLASTMRGRAQAAGGHGSPYARIADMLEKAADSGDYSTLGSWQSGDGAVGAAQAYMAVTRSSR